MKILGIDPGLRITGFGVLHVEREHLTYCTSGVISTIGTELAPRLGQIFSCLQELIALHQPDLVAIEQVFFNVNPKSTLLLGHARGAAICAAVSAEKPVSEYSANHIKQTVVGYGHATKLQVQHMVKELLQLSGSLRTDASDALAVAICHARTIKYTQALHKAYSTSRTARTV